MNRDVEMNTVGLVRRLAGAVACCVIAAMCVWSSSAAADEVYLADDGMTLTREGRKILGNGPPGSYDEEELGGATVVTIGDTWHLIYVGTKDKARVNTVMGATGKLNLSAPKSARLKPADRKRDFHRR